MVGPFEDNVSEVKLRKQRVAMERRVSSTEAMTTSVKNIYHQYYLNILMSHKPGH